MAYIVGLVVTGADKTGTVTETPSRLGVAGPGTTASGSLMPMLGKLG